MFKLRYAIQMAGAGVAKLTSYFAHIEHVNRQQIVNRYICGTTGLSAGAAALAYLVYEKSKDKCFCLKCKDDSKGEDTTLKPGARSNMKTDTRLTDPEEIKKMIKITGDSYRHAIAVTKIYTDKITAVMEKCIKSDGNIGSKLWAELKKTSRCKIEAENRLNASLKNFDPCVGSEEVRNNISDLRKQYEVAKVSAAMATKYWAQVMDARKHFKGGIHSAFPHADINTEEINMRGGKKDDILNMVMDEILLHQMMLSELQCELTVTVDRALTGCRDDIINAKIDLCLAKEKRKWAKKYQKKMIISKVTSDREMNEKLQQQALVHDMKIKDIVDAHTEKVIQEERKKNDERATAEKTAESLKLASMLGRLQAVDSELKARMESDKLIKNAQLLWASCEALEGVLSGKTDTRMKVTIDKELECIAIAAGPKDVVVKCILDGIENIKKQGVLSEKALYLRYGQVEKVCRSLAQVPEQGANLFGIILSRIQDAITKTPSPMPCEFTEPPKNTFETLERVRFYVDRRDWLQALRYIKLLDGIPKRVSHDWTCELIQHIEARQASTALLIHAYSTLRSS